METAINSPLIPTNETGEALDLTHTVTEDKMGDAINTFNRACLRLLNPPIWHELAGSLSASFKLTSGDGEDLHRLAELKDYIKIDIPGPGSSAGDGYDWVMIETIEENADPTADDSFGIKLRVCKNPRKTAESIAHFFKEDATSTFLVKRNENTITISYHGRNEIANSTEVKLVDSIRNSIIAAGALAGLSALQWRALIKGLLENEIGGNLHPVSV